MAWYDYIPSVPFQIGNALGGGKPAGSDGLKNWLTGGNRSKAFADQTQPKFSQAAGQYAQGQLGSNLGGRQLDYGQSNEARGQMMGLANQLSGVANGTQKGAGQLAVEREMGSAQAAQQSFGRMARGANAALAARQAARNTADLGVAGAGQAAMAQLQDQTAARAQLGGLLGNVRGQDLQTQGLNQSQMQANDSAQLGYLSQLLGVDQQSLAAAIAQQQVAQGDRGNLGRLLQGAGQLGMMYATGGFGGGPMLGGGGGGQAPGIQQPMYAPQFAPYRAPAQGPAPGAGLGSGGVMPWEV